MSTNDDISLPPGLARLRLRDPALADELTEDYARLSRASAALAWALGHLDALLGAPTDAALLARVVAITRTETSAPRVWALAWTGDLAQGRASFEAVAGDGVTLDAPPAVSRTVLGRVAREGRPAWSDDAANDARFQSAESVQAFHLRSVGCVPLGSRGALWLEDPDHPGRFGPATRVRVGALCAVAGRVFGARNPPPPAAPEAAGPEVAGPAPEPVPGLVGDTPSMHALFGSIRAFAPMPWPALILGETGTGKEAVARALHACSPRADAPLVAVNCGAIVASLAESTLFGHERGAFTGAERRRDGLLAQVDDGTLFLDEVGELSPDLQVKLLRVLQEGVYRRVGGRDDQPFRGRVVAATHRGLDRAETRGAFREDLFYRLAAAILRVPPLSERRADVPGLARHLLDRSVARLPPDLRPERVALAPATLAHLRGRAWPGNVRELENTLRQALALALARGDGTIWPADLGAPVPPSSPSVPAPESATAVEPAAPTAPTTTPAGDPVPLKQAVDRFQRQTIEATLAATGGNVSATARRLQVSRQWLHRLMARWEDP